jgi:O-antigen/teichoic acid export membrane protein
MKKLTMREAGQTVKNPLKQSSRKRRVLRNGFANLVGFVAQILMGMVTAPIIVHRLGDTRYGAWSLVESVLAYLTLFDLGLTASAVRFTSKFSAIDDTENRNRVISTCLALFTAIGLAAMAATFGLAVIGPQLFRFPDELIREGRWLFLLLGLNLAIGLPLNVFPSILAGLELYTITATIRTIALVIRSLAMVGIVLYGGKLVEIAVAVTVFSIAESVSLAIAVWRYLPDLRVSPALVSRETFRLIRGYSLDAFVIAINHRISFKTDPMVISFFLGPQFITPYILGKRLVGYATNALRAFTQVLTPAISAMESQGDMKAIRRVMIDGTRYVLWVIVPIELGLIMLGKPFLRLWMGDRLANASYLPMVVLALPLVLSLSQSVSTRILFGTSGLRWLSRAGILQSLSNLGLSMILVRPLGIVGVAIGTAIPNVIYNIAVEHRVCSQLGIGLREFFFKCYLKPLLLAPLLGTGWFLASRSGELGWFSLSATVAGGIAFYSIGALIMEIGYIKSRQLLTGLWARYSRT